MDLQLLLLGIFLVGTVVTLLLVAIPMHRVNKNYENALKRLRDLEHPNDH